MDILAFMKFQVIAFLLFLSILACSESKEVSQGKSISLSDSKTTTCQLVEKEFINKGSKQAFQMGVLLLMLIIGLKTK